MIFHIDNTSFSTMNEKKRFVFFHAVIRNHHLIDCNDRSVREAIIDCLGLKAPDDSIVKRGLFEISNEQKKYLTTIDVSNYKMDQLILLSGEKARLMIENGPYEWPIYKEIVRAYKKDSWYGNIAKWIYMAIDRHELYCLHGGGVNTFDALIELEKKEVYSDNTFEKKHVIIFDRDTNAPNLYDSNQNTLFMRLVSKDSNTVVESDVYSLNQNSYIWHVWYKRAIENYFPNERFNALGVRTNRVPVNQKVRDYCKMDSKENGCLDNYSKKTMTKIAKGMSWQEFESHLHKFDISIAGSLVNVSEFQLLLLKIAKII